MTSPRTITQRHTFQLRRRWIVYAILLLIAIYPISEGLMRYAWKRRWLPQLAYLVMAAPVDATAGRIPMIAELRLEYLSWWSQLAREHRPYVMSMKPPWREIHVVSDVGGAPTSVAPHGYVVSRDNGKFVEDNGVNYWTVTLVSDSELRIEEDRVTFDGWTIAKFPENVKINRVAIEYFDGEFEIDVNGRAIPVRNTND